MTITRECADAKFQILICGQTGVEQSTHSSRTILYRAISLRHNPDETTVDILGLGFRSEVRSNLTAQTAVSNVKRNKSEGIRRIMVGIVNVCLFFLLL